MDAKCPYCGGTNTRCLHEMSCDSLDGITIHVTCDDCGNAGQAEMIPTSITWEREEPEDD